LLAYPGCPGKEAVKRVPVIICYPSLHCCSDYRC